MHTADDVYSDAIISLRLAFEHVSALKSPDDSQGINRQSGLA